MDTNHTPTSPDAPETSPAQDESVPYRAPSALFQMAALARQSDARRDADTRLYCARMSRGARRRFNGD